MEFHELQQIVESNSKAIQAMLNGQAELREELRRSNQELRDSIELSNQELRDIIEQQATNAAAERQELRQAMIGIANLVSSLDSDRPTILRKLDTIENKVDRLLERNDGDQVQS